MNQEFGLHEVSLFDEDDWAALLEREMARGSDAWASQASSLPASNSRRVDLGPWLDGTYDPPKPTVGAVRSDKLRMLYPAKWHSVIALTAAGKSWFAGWHCAAELNAGNYVVYLHFEEATPENTIERLLLLGVALERLRSHLVWLDCDRKWEVGQLAIELAGLPAAPTLVVLDGILAACGQQGWKGNDHDTVGNYRTHFVSPGVRTGAAVLSLGHPPKAKDRQDERHGYGATGWLDEMDGVGFRMVASKTPISRGRRGHSNVYSVKDRSGQVHPHCQVDADKDGWHFVGQFELDNSNEDVAAVELRAPAGAASDMAPDILDRLGDQILYVLVRAGGQFESQKKLSDLLRAKKVTFNDRDLGPALMRLEEREAIVWPTVPSGKSRPGWVLADGTEVPPNSKIN